jgi:Holliday junction resolvase-like predicted endonuclease
VSSTSVGQSVEIDLVMTKDKIVYFIEVKFRSSGQQGSGLDYITDKKLAQMNRAAESWMALNKYDGDARLIATSVDGATSTIRLIEL